ncbi:MAG: HAD family hydrolase [Gammaproteobacteria bacterium]|nr:HAD family hydrolase [Gammaproteobacteria bacterium]
MHHVMFDIDGTLIQSFEFDEDIYACAVGAVVGFEIDRNWSSYKHVSDAGILNEIIETHGLDKEKETIQRKVKEIFVRDISNHINKQPTKEVPGAISFLNNLASLNNITISFATGGWYETAVLKLDSAGFNYSKELIASSNDHFKRTEIMAIAKAKHSKHNDVACTYFGDGIWDKEACEELGFNFVLVGSKIEHSQKITDYNSTNEAMAYIGL